MMLLVIRCYNHVVSHHVSTYEIHRAFLGCAFHSAKHHFCSKCGCMRSAEGQAWYRSFSRKWPAADDDESRLGLKTHAVAIRQSKQWLKQTCKTQRAAFVTEHGYRASMLHSLQYLNVINDHVFDLFYLILEGIL